MDSPFRPGFGKNPPFLAGRSGAIEQLRSGLEIGQWPQERGILITGMRGVGKTVMLNQAEDLAAESGWRVVSETASAGFTERIVGTHLPALLNELAPEANFRVTQIAAAGLGSITVQYPDGREETPTFRGMVAEILRLLDGRGGVLFSIDEVGGASAEEFAVFAGEYQHLVREDHEVAFIGAGVQGEVRSFLASTTATFLRRCAEVKIGVLNYPETLEAFREPIVTRGRTVSDETLDYLARAAQGYPFLVQSIGDIAWRSNSETTEIRLRDAQHGHRLALRTMGSFIHEPALSGLSQVDRSYLAAMAHDDGPSTSEDIRVRMGGVAPGYVSMYRDRLLGTGLIESVGYGLVTIAFPYLRDYLRSHIVGEAASDGTRENEGFPPPPQLD
ncbi:AAA ATPase-like protein [Leucobacter luti]|uniref:AAA ATPase-like protein n=1 Tax=Leucobacter luti TaxID=340320 RepID=A0A4R6S2P7_9MICO|nr:ATP-binding protein [Leucobacter luti]TDP93327.1 AAA ATPase-like protein [Leucobacter luti]